MDFLKWLFTSAVMTISGIFGVHQTTPVTPPINDPTPIVIEQGVPGGDSSPVTTGESEDNPKLNDVGNNLTLPSGTDGILPKSGNMPLTVRVAVTYTPACPPTYVEGSDDTPWWFWREQFKIEFGDGKSEQVYSSDQADKTGSQTKKSTGCGSIKTKTVTHTYEQFGTFNVSLKRILDGSNVVGDHDNPPKESVVKKIGAVTVTVQGSPTIAITAPTSVQKGSSIKVEWSGRNLPADSSIGFFIEHDVSSADKWKQPGPSGALSLKAQNVGGKTSGSFVWDGESFGCAPTDFPTICKRQLEPGNYVLKANIYDKKDTPLVLGLVANYKGPLIIAKAETRFTVGGSYNLEPVKQKLTSAAIRKVGETMKAYSFAGTHMERYVRIRGDLTGPDASGSYCATFDVLPPLSGTLKACGKVVTEVDSSGNYAIPVTGDVRVAAGTLSYAQAEQKAHSVADAPYLPRVDFKEQQSATGPNAYSTYLSTGVTNWAYRSDGGYWLFIIHEIKAGGQEGDPGRFADNVLVRVNNSGSACVIKTVPYSGGNLGVDIFTSDVSCL